MSVLPSSIVLTFHGIGTPPDDVPCDERPYWLDKAVFAATIAALSGVEAATGTSVHLSFDDGNFSDYEHALPLLRDVGRSAHVFAITGRIGARRYLGESQLRELRQAGFVIGSHGHRHVDLRGLSDADLADETTGSRRRLEDLVGAAVDTMSVPYGLFDARVLKSTRGAGYRRIYSSSGGFATADEGLIPRTSLRAGFDPKTDLLAMVGMAARMRSAVGDRLRRARYGALAAF